MLARLRAWAREVSHRMVQAEHAGDTARFVKLREKWIELQKQMLELPTASRTAL